LAPLLTPEEDRMAEEAMQHARQNKKAIAARLTDPDKYTPEENPVSVFMAGSPGAGKTEASIELISRLEASVIRIDPDELRSEFAAYNGRNAYLFQGAVSILVGRLLDKALEQDQSFLLDGTFARYEIARANIERSLKKKRTVQILYVYQEPRLAWDFVRQREESEGRRIPVDSFVDQYFGAREVVNKLKAEFGAQIAVDLLMKNNDNSRRFYQAGVDKIDHYIPENYTREQVEQLLKRD
jgi:UDP-N-acetylglucosamine kinase